MIDGDNDGFISPAEVRALILGIQFDEINLDHDDAVDKVMVDFDTSGDSKIDRSEFTNGVAKWLLEARRAGAFPIGARLGTMKYLTDFHEVRFVIRILSRRLVAYCHYGW